MADDFASERLRERQAAAADTAQELEQLRGKVKWLEEQLKRVRPDARTEHLLRENRDLRQRVRNQRQQLTWGRITTSRIVGERDASDFSRQELLDQDAEMRDRVAEALGMPIGLGPLMWVDDIIQRALQVTRQHGELAAELERVRPQAADLRRVLMLMAAGSPLCEHCPETTATCFGGYEHSDGVGFSCDEHCAHGCEDGWCIRIPQIFDDEQPCERCGATEWQAGDQTVICGGCGHEPVPCGERCACVGCKAAAAEEAH